MDWKALAALAALAISGAAGAQVHRCVDAAGKVSFSDAPCPTTAKSAARVLGADATDRRWENEVYGRERNMRSIENASRIIQEPTSDAQFGGPVSIGTPAGRHAGEPAPRAEGQLHPDDANCDTQSPRKGCFGGARSVNPNWSPRRGYFGGGGPADRRHQQEHDRAREIAERDASRGPVRATNCNAGGCWGSDGNRYNRTGDGQNFFRSDGKFCRANGNTFSCN